MTQSTVVLVTAAGRGIGRCLAEAFLSRPNHIVVGSVRDETGAAAQELKASKPAEGSRLVMVKLDGTEFADAAEAVNQAKNAGIDRIDIAIFVVGGAGGITPLDKVTSEEVTRAVNLNALGPLALYQGAKPLLERSKAPKWVGIMSAVGSIGNMGNFRSHVAPAYGIGKAGLNWITMTHIIDMSILTGRHTAGTIILLLS